MKKGLWRLFMYDCLAATLFAYLVEVAPFNTPEPVANFSIFCAFTALFVILMLLGG